MASRSLISLSVFSLKTWAPLLLLGIVLASCGQKNYIRPGDTLPVAFGKAKLLYENQKYNDAVEAFETVLSIGRGTPQGQEAQFYLAEALFKSGQYILAAAEFERFTAFYPRDQRKAYCEYMAAEAYYELSPIYKLDQEYTEKAINSYRLYLNNHPSDSLVQNASDRIDMLREKLAHKLFNAAEFYVRTADLSVRNNQYESAAIYYDIILEKYPETSWAEKALAYEIKALVSSADKSVEKRQLERYERAVEQYEKYLQLFPQGDHRELAESEYLKARKAIQRLEEKLSASN